MTHVIEPDSPEFKHTEHWHVCGGTGTETLTPVICGKFEHAYQLQDKIMVQIHSTVGARVRNADGPVFEFTNGAWVKTYSCTMDCYDAAVKKPDEVTREQWLKLVEKWQDRYHTGPFRMTLVRKDKTPEVIRIMPRTENTITGKEYMDLAITKYIYCIKDYAESHDVGILEYGADGVKRHVLFTDGAIIALSRGFYKGPVSFGEKQYKFPMFAIDRLKAVDPAVMEDIASGRVDPEMAIVTFDRKKCVQYFKPPTDLENLEYNAETIMLCFAEIKKLIIPVLKQLYNKDI